MWLAQKAIRASDRRLEGTNMVVEYIEFRFTFLYLDSIASPQFENRLKFRNQLPWCMCVCRLKQTLRTAFYCVIIIIIIIIIIIRAQWVWER
jgi:hypothetical protein